MTTVFERVVCGLDGTADDRRAAVNGDPAAVLLNESQHASLLALGSHGRRRAGGILLGTVATRMLHEAPCSVLIARRARDPQTWPKTVLVGVHGSTESALAVAAARSLANSCGAELRTVSATSDPIDREAAERVAPGVEELEGRAVGSVSERIAHQASCSILVVRGAADRPSG